MSAKKEKTVSLSAMHCAMIYRLTGQEPPDDVAGFRGPPGVSVAAGLAYMSKIEPKWAVELAQRLGYGSGSCGPTFDVPEAWVRKMLARGEGRVVQATRLEKPLDSVGYDGLTEGERIERQLAEICKEEDPEPFSLLDLE